MFSHDVRRDQLHNGADAYRQEDDVVYISEYRNEVGDRSVKARTPATQSGSAFAYQGTHEGRVPQG